jgi:hypothetical protein
LRGSRTFCPAENCAPTIRITSVIASARARILSGYASVRQIDSFAVFCMQAFAPEVIRAALG